MPRRLLWILSLALICLTPLSASSTFTSAAVLNCTQYGTSYASCSDGYEFDIFGEYFEASGLAIASASFGSLSNNATTSTHFLSALATAQSWFSDDVLVTGGTGSGTLVAHYSVSILGQATNGVLASPSSGFSFVTGETTTVLIPPGSDYTFYNLGQVESSGCGYGICFGESVDVSTPIQFGSLVPLGAYSYLTSSDFGVYFGTGGVMDVFASSTLDLTGFTVLDASDNVISDATVTPQDIPGLDLFPAPEPSSHALALFGLIALMSLIASSRRGKYAAKAVKRL